MSISNLSPQPPSPVNRKRVTSFEHEFQSDFMDDYSTTDKIKVCVRIRPILKFESESADRESEVAWKWSDQHIIQDKFLTAAQAHAAAAAASSSQGRDKDILAYSFDNLFGPEVSNEMIYRQVVKNLVQKSLDGYNGTIFAYGQTSSGKTFTMNGDSYHTGVIPQSIYDCFQLVDSYNDRDFIFRISYLEVYNEQVRDLLNPEPTAIKIQSDGNRVVLTGVREMLVTSPQQVISLLQGGEVYRHIGATDMNEYSSRAHSIFKLIIESKDKDPNRGIVRSSTLCLVDLAGSENAKMTNSKGERAREARHINQSLLTLSTIIQRLSDKAVSENRDDSRPARKSSMGMNDWEAETNSDGVSSGSSRQLQHLPYRDSKLTRIMQPSLSGNALIVVICTISPTVRCAEESHNTLKFAARAKKIKLAARVNEVIDDKTLLRAYRAEIELLRAKLAAAVDHVAGGEIQLVRRRAINENAYVSDETPPVLIGAVQDPISVLKIIEEMEKLVKEKEKESNSLNSTSNNRVYNSQTDPALLVSTVRKSLSSMSLSNTIEGKLGLIEGRDGFRSNQKVVQNQLKSPTTIREREGRSSSRSTTPTRRSTTPTTRPNTPSRTSSSGRSITSRPSSRASSPTLVPPLEEDSIGRDRKLGDMLSVLRKHISTLPTQALSSPADLTASYPTELKIQNPTTPKIQHSKALSQESVGGITLLPTDTGSQGGLIRTFGSSSNFASFSNDLDDNLDLLLPDSFASNARGVHNSETANMKRLLLDMRLIGADNRFLQEELEKRDHMLGTLTEGLREVEVVQINYQQENIRLKEALDKTKSELDRFLQENQELSELRLDLDVALQENRRLATENGRLARYVRELDKVLTSVGVSPHQDLKKDVQQRSLTPQRIPLIPLNNDSKYPIAKSQNLENTDDNETSNDS